jgi:hypothetical protein
MFDSKNFKKLFKFKNFYLLSGLLDLYVYDETSLTILATDTKTSSNTYMMQLDIDKNKEDVKPVNKIEFAQVKLSHALKLK